MRVPKSIQFALALVALFPFVIIALIFAGMITHIAYTTFHHHMAWQPTVATVLRAGTLCKITYQPEGAILRKVVARGPCERIRKAPLPTTGRKPRVEENFHGELAYDAGGPRRWEGELADVGIYQAVAGQKIALFYDPAAPDRLDTAAWKGWLGGLTIWGASVGFLVFYGWLAWFLWPTRRRPPGPPSRSGAVAGARRIDNSRGRTFGRA